MYNSNDVPEEINAIHQINFQRRLVYVNCVSCYSDLLEMHLAEFRKIAAIEIDFELTQHNQILRELITALNEFEYRINNANLFPSEKEVPSFPYDFD